MNNKAKTAAHVVLGLDKEGKPRAALVHPVDLEAASRAAISQGFKIGRAGTTQTLKLATQLPDAKVFATGKGLVPLVRKDIYEWLSKGLTFPQAKAEPTGGKETAASSPSAKDDTASTPQTAGASKDGNPGAKAIGTEPTVKLDPKVWEQLTVGSVVLAPEVNTRDDGYFPALITAVSKDGDKLTIRWRDFPKQPTRIVKRRSVALLLLDHS